VKTLLPAATPLIFPGDSNLRPGAPGFATHGASFRDTFTEVSIVFPDCRIDHVLLSPGAPSRTRSWSVDGFQYARGVASDHRAIVVDLK
jgi:endonuclease/exonuclease/phosphatase family metal-dependent hydrolase